MSTDSLTVDLYRVISGAHAGKLGVKAGDGEFLIADGVAARVEEGEDNLERVGSVNESQLSAWCCEVAMGNLRSLVEERRRSRE